VNALENLSYNDQILYETFTTDLKPQLVYLSKTFSSGDLKEQYFLKIYTLENGELKPQGYIYFYLNIAQRESKFIGIYIKPEYRNKNLSSLLISCWIKFCLDQNIIFLKTNKKQRKPFLLYLLKKFQFELYNPELYQITPRIISICRDPESNIKYLMFQDERQELTFKNSSIMREDNYQIIKEIKEPIQKIDQVILSKTYQLEDANAAYNRTLRIYQNHR